MNPRDDDPSFAEDALRREGGVFVSAAGGRKVECDDDCAQDDQVEDPVNEPGVPGTVDDIPYDYGTESAQPADAALNSIDSGRSWRVGATGPAGDADPQPLGRPEERELWAHQRQLIQEGEANEREYGALDEDDLHRIVESSIEDVADVLPDTAGGTSATGSVTED